jgi:hypothetical protein
MRVVFAFSSLRHGFESSRSHARLCTDNSAQDPAQRGLAAELVEPILPLPEHDPSDQQLLENLPALGDLAAQETPPGGLSEDVGRLGTEGRPPGDR